MSKGQEKLGKAKIAILCPGYGIVARGVETYLADLIPRLRQIEPEWSFDMYCRASGDGIPGMRMICVPAVSRDGFWAANYARIGHRLGVFLRTRIDAECLSFTMAAAPLILARKYDLIFNQAGPFAGRLLMFKRRLDGTAFIHETASGYSNLELLMARQRPDALIATSPFVENWLSENSPDVRIECIPKAIDFEIFRPYSSDEVKSKGNGMRIFDLGKPVILFVGAMDPMKRPELVISAVSRMRDASLVMIGNGRLAQQMKSQGEKLLGADRFLHIPHVGREEMALHYNACDVMTLPSEEPFGLVFIEALACGKPVVANNSPVQEWIIGEAGLTCDCADPDEYANALRRVIESNMAVKARERSLYFDWNEIAKRYAQLFSSVIEQGRGFSESRSFSNNCRL